LSFIGGESDEARAKMRPLQMRLITGKRETLHRGSGNVIREIRVTKVEEEGGGVGQPSGYSSAGIQCVNRNPPMLSQSGLSVGS
jgi:hypothetical protein